ncbi:hypothetical protein HPP92_015242 [Vanilla planifolia]|uniref:Nucleic acid-binding protein n=2 Tax=Vanilla planifolia TaxID=51239 RepID=A0A835QN66_VANPL|nr:hypothetical protein HPP92_015242 [Vanilla planifolia]
MESPSAISSPIIARADCGDAADEDDAFLGFVAYACAMLFPEEGEPDGRANVEDSWRPSWSWIVSRVLKTCISYPSGVTAAILLSDLFQAWSEQQRLSTSKSNFEWMVPLQRRCKRKRLPDTVTIDSIYEKNFLLPSSCLEVVVLDSFVLPGKVVRSYLQGAVFDQLWEYLVITVFCRQNIWLFCWTRIESVGSLQVQGALGSLQRKQITLMDNDGVKINFFLWGEQVVLANLFSVGSMLALDTPFISSNPDSGGMSEEFCLEYGSATQLYLVPFIVHEEQVQLTSTQMKHQGSKTSCTPHQSQIIKASQITLPVNAQGSIDFSYYPFQAFVSDLNDKMARISLYGNVIDIARDTDYEDTVFTMRIDDNTGEIVVKLHFGGSWSLGRLNSGHTVYITGLNCYLNKTRRLELSWFEKDSGSAFVNLSCLPALINSSCLHRLRVLSDIHKQINATSICSVHLNSIELHHIRPVLCHSICSHAVIGTCDEAIQCSFCLRSCEGELMRCFYLEVTVADESSKVRTWSIGQPASELLQISSEEFFELPEDEQAMYLYTLQSERFTVAIVRSNRRRVPCVGEDLALWEITRAQSCS